MSPHIPSSNGNFCIYCAAKDGKELFEPSVDTCPLHPFVHCSECCDKLQRGVGPWSFAARGYATLEYFKWHGTLPERRV